MSRYFNNTTLLRAGKRKYREDNIVKDYNLKTIRQSGCFSILQDTNTTCFFCDEPSGDLHKASTFQVDRRVRKCALTLEDSKLLAKLTAGDMITLDSMYHAYYLCDLYKRADKLRKISENESTEKRLEGFAIAELVSYIEDAKSDNTIVPVFKLAELAKMYTTRLEQFGVKMTNRLHTTKFKNRILAYFPSMQAHRDGRDIYLILNADIGPAVNRACHMNYDEEAISLANAAAVVRKDIFAMQKRSFGGTFEEHCQEKSVPKSVLILVSMIFGGPNIKTQTDKCFKTQVALTLSQLLIFNTTIRRRTGSISSFHSKDREPPLSLYLGLKIHAETRKRGLIDKLCNLGLSNSYDRVLELSNDIGNAVCEQSESEHIVCPSKLHKKLFTTGAIDNIDHNPSSTTAKRSLHGTGLSLFQHVTLETIHEMRDTVTLSTPEAGRQKNISPLPDEYINFQPVILKETQPVIPEIQEPLKITTDAIPEAIQGQYRWLEHVKDVISEKNSADTELEQDMYLSLAAFQASETLPVDKQARRHSNNVTSFPGTIQVSSYDQTCSEHNQTKCRLSDPRSSSCYCIWPTALHCGKTFAM